MAIIHHTVAEHLRLIEVAESSALRYSQFIDTLRADPDLRAAVNTDVYQRLPEEEEEQDEAYSSDDDDDEEMYAYRWPQLDVSGGHRPFFAVVVAGYLDENANIVGVLIAYNDTPNPDYMAFKRVTLAETQWADINELNNKLRALFTLEDFANKFDRVEYTLRSRGLGGYVKVTTIVPLSLKFCMYNMIHWDRYSESFISGLNKYINHVVCRQLGYCVLCRN